MNKAKNIIPVLLLLFSFISVFAQSYDCTVFINDLKVPVEVVFSDEDKARGLSNRKSMPEDEGMLFLFDTEDYRSFWMKDMLFPIDIIFIDRFGYIVHIIKNCQPCKNEECPPLNSKRKAKYVLEVNAGFCDRKNIREGDRVIIK